MDGSLVTLISDLISLIMISKFLRKDFIKIDQNQILMFKYDPDMKSYESKVSQTKSAIWINRGDNPISLQNITLTCKLTRQRWFKCWSHIYFW